jgi:hypothetical protein
LGIVASLLCNAPSQNIAMDSYESARQEIPKGTLPKGPSVQDAGL